MKTLAIFTLLFLAVQVFAQNNSGKGFLYQAVARATDGEVRQSENIEIRFSLYPGQHAVTPSWVETHAATTDPFGTFAVTVGKGIRQENSEKTAFSEVDFSIADYWLKVELMDDGVFQTISYTQLLSVPYCEAANNASAVPIGTIVPFAGTLDMVPDGWMPCDGRAILRDSLPELLKVIQLSWGEGDGLYTFNLPDLRGMFLRGVDHGRGIDPEAAGRIESATGSSTGDAVGSRQDSQFGKHDHNSNTGEAGKHNHDETGTSSVTGAGDHEHDYSTVQGRGNSSPVPSMITYGSGGDLGEYFHARRTGGGGGHTHGLSITEAKNHTHSISSNGGKETRPINVYVNYIIKVK